MLSVFLKCLYNVNLEEIDSVYYLGIYIIIVM